VAIAAAGFGTLGPLARFANEAGLSAASFATWRAIVAVLVMGGLLVVLVHRRRAPSTPWAAVPGRERFQLVAMGLFVAGTTISLFYAFERMSIALALTFFYVYPTVVAVIAVRSHGESLGARRVAAIALASVGMLLVVLAPELEQGSLRIDPVGVAFALAGGACQAAYALTAARGYASVPAFQAATLIRVFAVAVYAILLVPLVILVDGPAQLTAPLVAADAWPLIVVAGTLGAALPTTALVAGYRVVGPTRGAILMLFEPVVGVLLAVLLLAERPAPLQLLGGALVLVGAGLAQLRPPVDAGATRPAVAE
jgi:drug/metabolite transporter, DME family